MYGRSPACKVSFSFWQFGQPLALKKSADQPPIKASRFAALGTGRVLSIPRATGLITIILTTRRTPILQAAVAVTSSRNGRYWTRIAQMIRAVFVGHRHGRNFCRAPIEQAD
jgi:hypothetical protein